MTNEPTISDEYRTRIETASLDWQVAECVRWTRLLHEHSANEVKVAAITDIARRQHGEAFDRAVAAY